MGGVVLWLFDMLYAVMGKLEFICGIGCLIALFKKKIFIGCDFLADGSAETRISPALPMRELWAGLFTFEAPSCSGQRVANCGGGC
jgi:hypothetical protein